MLSPSLSRITKLILSSITERSFHGMPSFHAPLGEKVCHVFGTFCYPSLGTVITFFTRVAPVSFDSALTFLTSALLQKFSWPKMRFQKLEEMSATGQLEKARSRQVLLLPTPSGARCVRRNALRRCGVRHKGALRWGYPLSRTNRTGDRNFRGIEEGAKFLENSQRHCGGFNAPFTPASCWGFPSDCRCPGDCASR